MPRTPTTPRALTPAKRPKTGGRKKGTPNKSTLALREAIVQVYAELQAEAGGENGHFLNWARRNPTHFYKLTSRILPRHPVVPDGGPATTLVRRIRGERARGIAKPAGNS